MDEKKGVKNCLFCDKDPVYQNGFPVLEIWFGLCEDHAYVNYRKKSGEPRKKPQFNFKFTNKAWDWAKKQAALSKKER